MRIPIFPMQSGFSQWQLLGLPAVILASQLNAVVPNLSAVSPPRSVAASHLAQAPKQHDWSAIEHAIITEHNRVRQNPASYIPLLEERLAQMDQAGNLPNGCGPNCTLTTQEGQAAVHEAINFLRQQPALPPLYPNDHVAQAAQAQAQYQADGQIGHAGSNTSTPSERLTQLGVRYTSLGENIAYGPTTGQAVVLQLIIDDGVPSRGHRTNIFRPNWTHIGTGCGPHATYRTVCVINYIERSVAD